MSESKHTPGPWEVREGGNYIRVGRQGYNERADRERHLGAEAGGLFEADLRFQYTEADFAEALANARLVASAPEMLEALRGLMWPNVVSADDLMVLVLAAGVTSAQQEKIRPFVEALRKAQEAGRAAIRKATGGEQ